MAGKGRAPRRADMRLLFLGDIVGRPGRRAVTERLPALRERWRLDCVVINGENATGGFGITEAICDEILGAGAVADAVVIDIHAEATSEKQALGRHLDGRASLVVGTHTHVPTADGRVLPGGTAYMSDAGMCGDYDSVLGMQKEESIRRFIQKTPGPRMEPAQGEGTLSGVAVETDDGTGLAVRVAAVRLGPQLEEAWPRFWD